MWYAGFLFIFDRGGLSMEGIREGDVVQVHYTGTLQTGEVFDSSHGKEPLRLTIGEGNIIPGFEQALLGMQQGEKKKFELSPGEGFGERKDELVHVIERTQVPPDLNLEVGMQLALEGKGQDPVPAEVVDLTETTVTLDTNHPLAGKALTFEIDILGIDR
jgi:peptidylprolyl isomerase